MHSLGYFLWSERRRASDHCTEGFGPYWGCIDGPEDHEYPFPVVDDFFLHHLRENNRKLESSASKRPRKIKDSPVAVQVSRNKFEEGKMREALGERGRDDQVDLIDTFSPYDGNHLLRETEFSSPPNSSLINTPHKDTSDSIQKTTQISPSNLQIQESPSVKHATAKGS